jgi:hypothetical protein
MAMIEIGVNCRAIILSFVAVDCNHQGHGKENGTGLAAAQRVRITRAALIDREGIVADSGAQKRPDLVDA